MPEKNNSDFPFNYNKSIRQIHRICISENKYAIKWLLEIN